MYFVILTVVILFSLFKLYQKCSHAVCESNQKMYNKVVIVTGANTGIGFETAKDLAKRGAKVILACRSETRGTEAVDKIIQSTGNKNVFFKPIDLASLKSVYNFAEDLWKTEAVIHVLINNAATGNLDNSLTEDELPIEVQVNHFSPFLLTILLLPLLKRGAPSRIVTVASIMHTVGYFDANTFAKQATSLIGRRRAYSDTKLANILFTKKLSKVLEGTGITVNCLHPGAVSTEIFRHQNPVNRFFISLAFKTPWEGAQTSIHLAVSPDIESVSGKYFADCKETEPFSHAKDEKNIEQLWELSKTEILQKIWPYISTRENLFPNEIKSFRSYV